MKPWTARKLTAYLLDVAYPQHPAKAGCRV